MGITDYLSRYPIFEALPAEDESELVLMLIRSLNQQKNINYLKQAVEVINSESQKRIALHSRSTTNKRNQTSGRQLGSEKQTERRRSNEKRENCRSTSETVKLIKSAINRPIRSEHEKRELKRIRKSIRNTIQLSRSPFTCKLIESSSKPSNLLNFKMQTAYSSDTESQQSNVINDLDALISITQAKIDDLKKAVGICSIGNRAEVYRPNKETRSELKVLE